MTMEGETPTAARRALRTAKLRDNGNWSDSLAVAYMRLLAAYREGHGVRLTPDEVHALFAMDGAINLAALNIEAEMIGEAE
ncbi:MAG: hypothetical protein Q8S13_02120, partial [Dehalococcoidia bacterium]|nr:hypothetical protein [Dehalococcoidia bacterium]